MGKEILKHYEALMLEKKDIENRIAVIEKELKNYEKGPQIQESVCGGAGGVQRFTVRGFPHSEHKRKKTMLLARKLKMESVQKEIEDMIREVESYISGVDNPIMRIILRLRYLDGKSWEEVSKVLGPGYSKDAVRKKCERFMAGNGGIDEEKKVLHADRERRSDRSD